MPCDKAHRLAQGNSQNDIGSLLFTIIAIKVVANLIIFLEIKLKKFRRQMFQFLRLRVICGLRCQSYQRTVKLASFYAALLGKFDKN